MKTKIKKSTGLILFIILISLTALGCSSVSKAREELNTTPDNLLRGDPQNTERVREYLQDVLTSPEGYEVRAFSRKPFSVNNKKGFFMVHYYYVYYKDGLMEHTLVFTDTPKGSERKGSWMLDALSDVESYEAYELLPDNPWQVELCKGPKGQNLDTIRTTQNILKRLERNFKFFGGAVVRDKAWYHQIWMFMVPPPILGYGPLLIMGIHKDNCASAVLETMAWEKR